jgi:hypothetical protein
MTTPKLARRLVCAYRAQIAKEDLAQLETQFTAIDRQLGVVRSGLVAGADPLESLWRLPSISGGAAPRPASLESSRRRRG